jgi:hypothetical protein
MLANKGILKSWPNRLSRSEYKISPVRNFLRLPLELLDSLELNDAIIVSKISKILLKITRNSKSVEESKFRLVFTRLFPWDPLVTYEQSPIDVFILTHEKDIDILPYSILGAVESIKDNLRNVFIVAPSHSENKVKSIISNIYQTASYISDEEILDEHLRNIWITIPTVPRMEILKICCGLLSPTGNALIIDGDTILLRSRVWSNSNKCVAIVAQEYLKRHLNFNKNRMGIDLNLGIGFVSHHGVAIKKTLSKFISQNGGIVRLAEEFKESYLKFKNPEDDFPSEWQLISDLNIFSDPINTELVKFSNYGMSRDATNFQFSYNDESAEVAKVLANFRAECPKLGSISFHGYK